MYFFIFLCIFLLLKCGEGKYNNNISKKTIDILSEANELKNQGKLEKSAELLRIINKTGIEDFSKEKLECLFLLGVVEWDLGNVNKSYKIYSDLNLSSETKNYRLISERINLALDVINHYREGVRLFNSNEYHESIKVFDDAISLSRELGIIDFEGKLLRQQSVNYWHTFNYEKYLEYNRKAIEIAQKTANIRELGLCFNNVGVCYFKLKDLSASLYYLDEGIKNLETSGDQKAVASCLSNIGLVDIELGIFANAERKFDRVLKIDESSGDKLGVAFDYINMGMMKYKNFLYRNHRPLIEEAIKYYEKGLDMLLFEGRADSFVVDTYINLGVAYYKAGDLEKAARFLRSAARQSSALKLKEKMNVIDLNLGDVSLAAKSYGRAKNYYQKVIRESSLITELNLLIDAHFGIGRISELSGDYEAALSSYYNSMELIERARGLINLDIYKTGFSRDKLLPYYRALDILYQLYSEGHDIERLNEILSLVERTKARAFFESLAEARSEVRPLSEVTKSSRIKNVSKNISAAILKLGSPGLKEFQKQQIRDFISSQEEEYLRILSSESFHARDRIFLSPRDWSLNQLREEVIDEKTALVEFLLGEKKSFAIYVTRKTAGLHELPGRPAIEDSVKAYLRLISFPASDSLIGKSAALRLGNELAGFLNEVKREGVENLLVIPDGILHHLPFETLAVRRNEHDNYLVEDFNIYYAPSASALALIENSPREKEWAKKLLAFGAPDYSQIDSGRPVKNSSMTDVWREVYSQEGFHFSPLPFSKVEVRKIAENFEKERVDILTGTEANEHKLKNLPLRDYQILHFACHSLLDEKNPIRSALMISPSVEKGEDGFFQAREIYGIDITADLVVLSACQSGDGTLEQGEGLMGLPRLFFYGGARSVLSTLWFIGDKTTATFMQEFYRNLTRGESKSSALRLAKLSMMKSPEYSHPFYWAGYILSGDPAPVFENN